MDTTLRLIMGILGIVLGSSRNKIGLTSTAHGQILCTCVQIHVLRVIKNVQMMKILYLNLKMIIMPESFEPVTG